MLLFVFSSLGDAWQVRKHSRVVFWLAGLALVLGLAAGLNPARAAGEDPPAAGPSSIEQLPPGFGVGRDTPLYPLAAAPAAYAWHTFHGGDSSDDGATAIAVDSSGAVYVVGGSDATWTGPAGQNPLHPYTEGEELFDGDVMVVKLDSNGAYQWHTFYGGSGFDRGYDVAVDSSGIYLAGQSYTAWTGPEGQAPLHAFNEAPDIVVVKLDSDGAYQWHTFYGGSSGSDDLGFAIAADGNGGVYVGGWSSKTWTGPEGENPLNAWAEDHDLVVVKLDSAGVYQWHTFYGGGDSDYGYAIAVDSSGGVYLTGLSDAAWTGPEGQDPLHPFTDGGPYASDMVVVKLDSAGAYRWHTFYGGSNSDAGFAIALDSSGGVYMAGASDATWTGPEGQDPLNALIGGNIVVVKLDSAGAYRWHTFYGGSDYDVSWAIAVDGSGGVYVGGWSNEPWTGPKDEAPLDAWTGNNDMVMVRLGSDGTYRWHTFYGGAGSDGGNGMAVAGSDVYLAGFSYEGWTGPGEQAPLNAYAGGVDITVVKTSVTAPVYGSAPPVGSSIDLGRAALGRTVTASLTISNSGSAALEVTGHSLSGPQAAEFGVTPTGLVLPAGGPAQRLVLACTPAGGGPRTATLTVVHNAAGSPAVYSLACSGGYVYLPVITTP